MQTLHYCVQCTDRKSNTIGDFAYDIEAYKDGKGFHAIGPVFHSLVDFYTWAYLDGWKDGDAFGFTMVKPDAITEFYTDRQTGCHAAKAP